MKLSLYWAKRSKKAFGINTHKALFGIVQGGLFKDLRLESLKELIKMVFMTANGLSGMRMDNLWLRVIF